MKVETKITGVDQVLRLLKDLPAEVVSKRGGPVKLALAKGARIIRDEAKRNVAQIIAEPNKGGLDSESTGLLAKSIIASRGKPPEGEKGERYLVRLRPAKKKKYANTARNRRSGKVGKKYEPAPPAFYGGFLEYGTSKMRPHPWLRRALQAKGAEAIEAISQDLLKRVDDVVKKLAAKGGGK